MKDWFLDNQFKVALILGIVCVVIVFAWDFRAVQTTLALLTALILIYTGQRLFQADTSENWLRISYGELIRNVLGSVLMLFGWILFIRGVLAVAIASILLRVG